MLTKIEILAGIQCEKRLWLQGNTPQPPYSRTAKFFRRQGQEIEKMASKQFPKGWVDVRDKKDENVSLIDHTRQLMESGAEFLFKPSFSAGGALVQCDILRKRDNAWDIVEIQSSLWRNESVKDAYLYDLAVQWHVVGESNVQLGGAFLMLVNSEFSDGQNEFMLEKNVTEEVKSRAAVISEAIPRCASVLVAENAPDVRIGEHCDCPFVIADKPLTIGPDGKKKKGRRGVEKTKKECRFVGRCHNEMGMPEASIFTIPNIRWGKKDDMIARGVLYARDADVTLSPTQKPYVDFLKSGKLVEINKEAIRKWIDELEFPLCFLDFETISSPIPRFGMRPYQHLPFQFSCHTLSSNNEEDAPHDGYLHVTKDDDPRPPLLSRLVDCVGETGSIVAWSAGAEDGFLDNLSSIVDDRQREILMGMKKRLMDLQDVFKVTADAPPPYQHQGFLGGASLKTILPVLTDKSYDTLEIKDGRDAMAAWDLTIRGEKDHAKDLIEYCHLDTKAMVLIYRHILNELAQCRES